MKILKILLRFAALFLFFGGIASLAIEYSKDKYIQIGKDEDIYY